MDGRRTGESEQAYIARLNDEIERLRKENAELKELLQATVDYTGVVASSPNISFYPSPKWHLVTNGAIQEITIGKTTGDD